MINPSDFANQNPNFIQKTQDFFKNPFPAIGQAIKSFVTPPSNQGNVLVQPQNVPQYYQVKPTDTSLSQVAQNNNVPLQQIVDANNGMKSLPPVGSYLDIYQNVPKPYQNAAVNAIANRNPVNTGGTEIRRPTPDANTVNTPYIRQDQTMVNQARNNFYETQALNKAVETFQLTGQLPSSTALPGTVSLDTQKNLKFLPTDMQMMGYQYDPSKNVWVNQASAAAGNQIRPQTNNTGVDKYGGQYVQQGATRWVRDASGKLKREVALNGKWRKQRNDGSNEPNPTPTQVIAEPQNASDTASMGITLKQGSG